MHGRSERNGADADGDVGSRPCAAGSSLALVLGGGGARAAYQVGVLSGIAEKAGDVAFPIITGESAGAIHATRFAAYQGRLAGAAALEERLWLRMSTGRVFKTGSVALFWSAFKWLWMITTGGTTPGFTVHGILDTRPLRKHLSSLISTRKLDANLASGRLRALALSATSYATGRTITFVHGAEDVPTWRRAGRVAVRTQITIDHVLASCALPLVFPAIEVAGEHLGDGSLRQTATLAPAVHLGADRIVTVSVRCRRNLPVHGTPEVAGYPTPAQIIGMLFNSVFMDALEADAERLARINRTLALLPRGVRHPDGLRPVKLLVLRPSRGLGGLAADLMGYLPKSLRVLVRGMGASGTRSHDFLSYLLFERPYIERLIELGRNDVKEQWDQIAPMLEPEAPSVRSRVS